MTAMRIVTAAGMASALALGMAGCKRPEEAGKTPAAPVGAAPGTPADAAAPLSFEQKTGHATVELKMPPAIKRQPDLHARLYSEGVKNLKAFTEGAAGERAEMAGQGVELPPYSREIEWHVGADTSKLLSLWKVESEYTGGAHGNASYGAVLWDKALKRMVGNRALFKPGVDAAMDKALCDALAAQKKERLGEYYTPPGQDWTCPKWRDVSFALVPSTTAGKAGGLVFLLPPYAVGAYAEGTYEVTVPQGVFARWVTPGYADEFAGAPKPETTAATGAETPQG